MLNLTYHPSADPYHCAFRAMRLLEFHQQQVYKTELFGFLDFYLLFPFLLKTIRMSQNMRATLRRLQLDKIPEPYQKIPDSRRLFRQVERVQHASYRNLSAADLLDIDAYREGFVARGSQALSTEILDEIRKLKEVDATTLIFLLDHLSQIPLYGPDGLKARTGLMEYRYDAA
jgi:hypothetical protein